jgi:hypothetical protein
MMRLGSTLRGLGMALALLAFAPTSAWADELADLKQKIETSSLKLAELRAADSEQATTQDLARIELWLREAQARLANEDEDSAAYYLRRVDVGLEMTDKLIIRAKADKTTFEREAAAVNLEKESQESKLKLDQAETKEKALLLQIEELRKTAEKMKSQGQIQ